MRVHSPQSVDDALTLLAARGAALTPIAGGTDLLVSWHLRPKDDAEFLDLLRLRDAWRYLHWTDEALEIGALATYWDVITDDRCAAELPLLVQAGRQVGAIQIQSRGTWAGNIGNASPAADGVPVLLAYDATVVLVSKRGRREVALCDYFTGYKKSVRAADELIGAIRVPRRRLDAQWFHKVGARAAQAITKVGIAIVREGATWRIAANSVAPFVVRCRALEAALQSGRVFATPREIEAVLKNDVAPIDDIRSTSEYRFTVLARLLHAHLNPTAAL